MSKSSDAQNKTLGTIAAIQTIVNSYPKLNLVEDIMNAINASKVSPMEFLLRILKILGLTPTEMINWIAMLLSGEKMIKDEEELMTEEELKKEEEKRKKRETRQQNRKNAAAKAKEASDGILTGIENVVKALLFANIKNMFLGCAVEPFIPYYLLDNLDENESIGLRIPVSQIDMFGVLKRCPVNDMESVFYFDCKPNIYGFNYTPDQTVYSTDFNAFLWHVINKSDANGDIWDNRNFQKEFLLSDYDVKNPQWGIAAQNFYNVADDPINRKVLIPKDVRTGDNTAFRYKPILRCQFENSNSLKEDGAIIKVTLPKNTYTRYFKIGNTQYTIPKTIFEFNYDYIWGLKLFETKTMVANVLNSMMGLMSLIPITTDVKEYYNLAENMLQYQVAKNKVTQLINNLVMAEGNDDIEQLCATNFSNADYNTMLNNSNDYISKGYGGGSGLAATDVEALMGKVAKLETSSSVSQDLLDLLNTTSEITKEVDGKMEYSLKFDFSFLEEIVKTLMIELVMQILSPKVMMLFYINTCIMKGSAFNLTEWSNMTIQMSSIEGLLAELTNLFISIAKQVIEIFLKQLLELVIEKIMPWIKILTLQLLLETIRDYKDLIIQLITYCLIIPNFDFGKQGLQLDKVNYADLTPVLEVPNNDC